MCNVQVLVTGPRGSGKSTIARMIQDMLEEYDLACTVDDSDAEGLYAQDARIVVLQERRDFAVEIRTADRHTVSSAGAPDLQQIRADLGNVTTQDRALAKVLDLCDEVDRLRGRVEAMLQECDRHIVRKGLVINTRYQAGERTGERVTARAIRAAGEENETPAVRLRSRVGGPGAVRAGARAVGGAVGADGGSVMDWTGPEATMVMVGLGDRRCAHCDKPDAAYITSTDEGIVVVCNEACALELAMHLMDGRP